MLARNLLLIFSAAVAALSVDEARRAEEARAVEARAVTATTLYRTTTLFTTSRSTSTSCLASFFLVCVRATTRTVTTTVPTRTTTVPYTTQTVTVTTSSAGTSSTSRASTTTSSSVRTSSATTTTRASSTLTTSLTAITSTGSATQTTSTAASTTTSGSPTSQPTCGLKGYDKDGTNAGFYANVATYAACNDFCTANPSCLSFAYGATNCILYAHVVEGNVNADPNSPYTYFNRGGACQQQTSPTSTAPATPSFTAGIQYCPAGQVKYNVTAPATGYMGCNSTYADSTCASDVGGAGLCNLCGSCYKATGCASTADCQTTYGAGYACVSGSACVAGGKPVCLYMMNGGPTYGCRGSSAGLW